MKIYKIICSIGLILSSTSMVESQNIKVVADERTNSLIIKAPMTVQKQIESLVKDLDEENRQNLGLKIVQLVYLQASEISPLLSNVMSSYKPTQVKSSQLSLNSNTWNSDIHGVVLPDDRTNKIIIMSDNRTSAIVEKVIKELDKKTNSTNSAMLLKIKNADVTLVSNLIQNVSGKKVN
jgi:type II secretory pathway component GspD/PulD (secretin)